MKIVLFCDMDGVLSDFEGAVQKYCGYNCHTVEEERMFSDVRSVPDFWESISPMPDLHKLWSGIKKYNPYILTAVASWDRHRCYLGKQRWLKQYLPEFNQRRLLLVTRSQKQLYSKSKYHFLIDDYHKNCNEWNAGQGRSYLYTHDKRTKILQSIAAVQLHLNRKD